MALVIDFLRAIFDIIAGIVARFAQATGEAHIAADPLLLVLIAIVLTIWLGSACWAGSIAEMRRHAPKLHFFIGLVLPLLYPLVILFALDVKGAKARDRERQREKEQAAAAAAPVQPAAVDSPDIDLPIEQAEAKEETTLDEHYFTDIALDDQGNPTGPWRITYGDTEIVAQRIVDALPHAVVIETLAADGKAHKIRIPYSKISGCEAAE